MAAAGWGIRQFRCAPRLPAARAVREGRGAGTPGADYILGRSVPFIAPSWDERLQVFQTPDHVALHDETGELRLVPVTRLTQLPQSIRQCQRSPERASFWTGRRPQHVGGV